MIEPVEIPRPVIEPVEIPRPVIELVEIPAPMSAAGATVEAIPEEGHTVSKSTASVCPKCGNDTGIPIAYGLPGRDLMDRAQRGEVALGGCLVMDDNPNWRCQSAGCCHEWRGSPTDR